MGKIRVILADPRLKGHFGYASMDETEGADAKRLLQLADILESWVFAWHRKM